MVTGLEALLKQAGVLAHIAGPTASGKSTLLRQLKKDMPGLTTQDLDQFYFRARANLKDQLPASSSDWTDEQRAQLNALRKSKFDAWLGEHQAEPIVLGGHHLSDGAEMLPIPGGEKFLLNTGTATSAVRRYRRSQNNKDESKRQSVFKIPSSWAENRKNVGQLKALGYQPLDANGIAERIRQLT
jgi:energy-coupling factor transporter ATP-binding protein EcfA2